MSLCPAVVYVNKCLKYLHLWCTGQTQYILNCTILYLTLSELSGSLQISGIIICWKPESQCVTPIDVTYSKNDNSAMLLWYDLIPHKLYRKKEYGVGNWPLVEGCLHREPHNARSLPTAARGKTQSMVHDKLTMVFLSVFVLVYVCLDKVVPVCKVSLHSELCFVQTFLVLIF